MTQCFLRVIDWNAYYSGWFAVLTLLSHNWNGLNEKFEFNFWCCLFSTFLKRPYWSIIEKGTIHIWSNAWECWQSYNALGRRWFTYWNSELPGLTVNFRGHGALLIISHNASIKTLSMTLGNDALIIMENITVSSVLRVSAHDSNAPTLFAGSGTTIGSAVLCLNSEMRRK